MCTAPGPGGIGGDDRGSEQLRRSCHTGPGVLPTTYKQLTNGKEGTK